MWTVRPAQRRDRRARPRTGARCWMWASVAARWPARLRPLLESALEGLSEIYQGGRKRID